MAKCKNCGESDKTWTQDENSKWRLLNADGSRHYCMGGGAGSSQQQPQAQQQQQQQQGTTYMGASHSVTNAPRVAQEQQQIPQAQTQQQFNDIMENLRKIAEQIELQNKFYEGLVGELQVISKSVHKAFLIADKADQFLEQSKITDAKIDRLVARFTREEQLARQEEEYDKDKEDGTVGLA